MGEGDTPYVKRGTQKDYKRLYYSDHMAARRVPVQIQSGYGWIEMGSAMAKNISAGPNGGKNQLLPYNPTTFPADIDPGRAYLVTNTGSADNFVYVTMDDSYKFKVGDDLIINDNTTAAENLGVITAIDRTTERQRAKITATTNIGGTAFTTARRGHVLVEAGAANNFSDCVGILEKSVQTGVGEHAQGAGATLILGNAILYDGMLTNLDSTAKTKIGATTWGQFVNIP